MNKSVSDPVDLILLVSLVRSYAVNQVYSPHVVLIQ
jgi:hypothetical protein